MSKTPWWRSSFPTWKLKPDTYVNHSGIPSSTEVARRFAVENYPPELTEKLVDALKSLPYAQWKAAAKKIEKKATLEVKDN